MTSCQIWRYSSALLRLPAAVAVFYPLLAEVTETVGQAVIENQSAENAVESENPHSAQAILDAVAACLEQAER